MASGAALSSAAFEVAMPGVGHYILSLALVVFASWRVSRVLLGAYLFGLASILHLVAQGIGIWLGIQTFFNIGVNMGLLPTKGLTLPLMSFGGSAMLCNLASLAVLLRVDYENRRVMRGFKV